MKILFVTTNSSGSGEAISALHMGRSLTRSGHQVRYFADPFTARFLSEAEGADIDEIPDTAGEIEAAWLRLLHGFKPKVIVFADYALLSLSQRGRRFLQHFRSAPIDRIDADLVTLDHLGMAQGPLTLPFGPPHLELFPEHIPALPERMRVLLPCPMRSPTQSSSGRGVPFRQYDTPLALDESRRQEVRRRFIQTKDDLLVFHSAPSWAIEFCRRHSLPNYSYLARLFEMFFGHLPRPVVVVSVNGQSLLQPSSLPGLRLINLSQLSPSEYDMLFLSSDLMITDNRISATLGKAVCGLVPCATLRNSYSLPEVLERSSPEVKALAMDMERHRIGSVFPFEVFPIWSRDDLNVLGLLSDNPIQDCICTLEMYDEQETRLALERLMTDGRQREELLTRQRGYVSLVSQLPASEQALLSVIE